MTFGEHLEVLRIHLFKAIIGLTIAVIVCLIYGVQIVAFVRQPIDQALKKYSQFEITDDTVAMQTWQRRMYNDWGFDLILGEWKEDAPGGDNTLSAAPAGAPAELPHGTIRVRIPVNDLLEALHNADPARFSRAPPQDAESSSDASGESSAGEREVALVMSAPEFAEFQRTTEQAQRPVTFKVEEAFATYVKVSLIAGLVLSSPWIYYQLWLFVAEGLYPHERRYVHIYGTMSLALFLFGAIFCYYAVFPFVLKFLLGFNATLQIHPQIRLSEWISFAVMLPVMFGISFQLPLVMLFLERISIFNADAYVEKRRLAVLVIAFLSMVLTPADPMSMILMLVPLVALYELGIILCRWSPTVPKLKNS